MTPGLTSLPFHPVPEELPLLPKAAKSYLQLGRLLDALVVLGAVGSCPVRDLAARVGLHPDRMRELLVAYMVAGADSLGADAPLNITFGSADGPLTGDEDDDDAQSTADVVYLDGGRGAGLLEDLGRRPVMVRDIAKAVLAGTLLAEDGRFPAENRMAVQLLVHKLAAAMGAVVEVPAEAVATPLERAVRERRVVRFQHLHPWSGERSLREVEPYDVRRSRDRLVLDAGPGLTTYDLDGITDLEVLDMTFEPPLLPPREVRTPSVPVVLRVSDDAAERRLTDGWGGLVVGPADGGVDVRIQLDGDIADPGVVDRLGALLLQLGPVARVVSPPELATAGVRVAQRVLDRHA